MSRGCLIRRIVKIDHLRKLYSPIGQDDALWVAVIWPRKSAVRGPGAKDGAVPATRCLIL